MNAGHVALGFGGGGVRQTVGAQMGESVEFVGGVLVEMCTETPQSQQSVEIQRVHETTKHVDRDCAHLQVLSSDQVVRSGLPAAWSPWALSP